MKECIWLHYDREWIFNPPEKKQLLFIWPLLLTEGSSFIYERMYMITLWQGVYFQSNRGETITFHLTYPTHRGIFIHIWKNVYDCIMTGSEFSIHQRRNNYFSFDLSCWQRDLHSYMKECIWLHYDREWIFNPPEKKHLLSFDISCSQSDLHSYMKESIWLHYDRKWISQVYFQSTREVLHSREVVQNFYGNSYCPSPKLCHCHETVTNSYTYVGIQSNCHS